MADEKEENQEEYRLLLKMHADSDELREVSGKILELIDQIALQNPVLAGQLTELASNFEYKRLLMVIERAGAEA